MELDKGLHQGCFLSQITQISQTIGFNGDPHVSLYMFLSCLSALSFRMKLDIDVAIHGMASSGWEMIIDTLPTSINSFP